LDDVGLDVAVKAGEVLQAAFPGRMSAAGDEALVAAGRLGRKSGKGFYEYDAGKRGGPSKEAYAALSVEPAEKPPLSDAEIEERLVLPMINEAAFCLEEGVVARPEKLDLAMIFGTGFPPFRGGLLRYADEIGAGRIAQRLSELARRVGPRFAPAPLLERLASAGGRFYGGAAAISGPEAA
jgi:3-hydroxyacyl-CoA dehydrogenase